MLFFLLPISTVNGKYVALHSVVLARCEL